MLTQIKPGLYFQHQHRRCRLDPVTLEIFYGIIKITRVDPNRDPVPGSMEAAAVTMLGKIGVSFFRVKPRLKRWSEPRQLTLPLE